MDAEELFEALGLSEKYEGKLPQVSFNDTHILLWGADAVHTIPCPVKTRESILQGTASPLVRKLIAKAVADHMEKILAEGGPVEGGIKKWTEPTVTPLGQAKEMYQPVMGSSPGSRYYVIGRTAGTNFAAKFDPGTGKVSIRAEKFEGPASTFQVEEASLILSGLEKKAGGHYSLHCDCGSGSEVDQLPTARLAKRTIGAVLCSTGLWFQTETPNLDRVFKECTK